MTGEQARWAGLGPEDMEEITDHVHENKSGGTLCAYCGAKFTPNFQSYVRGTIVDTTNPKDLVGSKKVSLSSVPPIAIAHEAMAMMDGAAKYQPYNWREKKVQARIYVDAALRHITSWFEGEEYASDSGVHHLGHARACLGILLDAITTGNLIDNRPIQKESTRAYITAINKINEQVKNKNGS